MAFNELVDFSGGINAQNVNYLIAPNEAVYSQNANISNGNIQAVKDKLMVGSVLGKSAYYYVAHNQVVSSTEDRFYVEYNGFLYWSNSAGTMKRYNGTITSDVGGWTAPSTACTTSAGTTGRLSGDYIYTFTYVYDSGFESIPAPYSTVLTVSSKVVSVSFTGTPPSGAVYRRLYRTGGINPTFNRIADIPVATTSYTDSTADIDVDRQELSVFTVSPPPSGLDMLINSNGVFWGALGKQLWFSEAGTPENFPVFNYVELPSAITGIGSMGGYVIAFTQDQMFQIIGDTTDTIQVVKMPFRYGCGNKRTVKNLDGMLIWYSKVAGKDIICSYDGNTVTQLSDKYQLFTSITLENVRYADFPANATYNNYSLAPVWAEVFDKRYFLAQDNRITIFDFNSGFRISCLSDAVDSLFLGSNSLLCVVGSNYYDLLPVSSQYRNVSHMTGKFIDGSYTLLKQYRRVRCNYSGTFTVSVIVDGVELLSSTDKSFYLPAEAVGNTIQFNIKSVGYGQFNSISYEYQGLAL